ncbi:MAG: hemolysin III family protein, partial [Gemmatimonadales bacterium]|nr:hemolysin III family protein [Gemmatimonadales bacterium]
ARTVTPTGLAWLGAGGLAYTMGAIVFAGGRPDPVPGRFGTHEIWHLFVLLGSGCHFAFMAFYVAAL